jgi:H+/Cl- antiporter ClcA
MSEPTTPYDLDIRSRPFYKLLLVSGLVGVTGALLTFAFFLVLKFGTTVVWELVPRAFGLNEGVDSPLFILSACLLGGFLVGLITYLTKVKPQLLAEEMEEITDNGRIDPRSGLVGMLRGLVGLIFGGSIGPEGPLTGGSGALGTWLAERLRLPRPVVAVSTLSGMSGMFGSFLASPFGFAMFAIEGGLEKGKLSWKLLLPSIVAASLGYTVFFALTGYTFGGNYQFPGYDGWNIIDLGYAVLLGLAGGALGLLFIFIFKHTRDLTSRWRTHPIGLAVLGGLILGLVGMVFPLILFSGDAELQVLLDDATELGLISLLVIALMKVLVTAMCLSLGWSGGYIFPSLFMGAALGLAIHQALPFIPDIICLVCVMSGVAVALMKSPIALAFIVQALFDVKLAPVIAISILAAFLLTYRYNLVPDRKGDRVETGTALP